MYSPNFFQDTLGTVWFAAHHPLEDLDPVHSQPLGQVLHGHHTVLITFGELLKLERSKGAASMDPPETVRIILLKRSN